MKVFVFETNLLWSSKLKAALIHLGHTPFVLADLPQEGDNADVAIVNLSQRLPDPTQLIADLRTLGVTTIAHAGHKETELIELGKAARPDLIVTNGELSAKLDQVLERAMLAGGRSRE